jgi:exo-1,4-beta-D-glucosaminidase
VHPADPRSSLSIGWVDWNPTPPDNNMGPWRGVDIVRRGPVEIGSPQVTSTLSLPDLSRAALTVKVQARNLDASAHDATITGVVAGVSLRRTIHLDAGQTQTVSFSPKSDPGLDLKHPQVWWPVGMGAHPLYTLQMAAAVDGAISDRAGATFGIRSVSSHLTAQGYHQFVINGKPVLIRGAGWAPDMFLRDDPKRMETEFSYVVNLGLNTIRSEGKLEDARFYDLADRNGIMILAGWECCDKWESWAKTGGEPWDAADEKVAAASMASEARLLRNHPSVIGFLIGSDNAPPAAISKIYVDTLRAEDWPLPIIAAAVPQATPETGPSGMKMEGPYSWVPPAYWYADKLGGAYGFDSEVSAGSLHSAAGRSEPHALAAGAGGTCGKIRRRGSFMRRPPGRYSRPSSRSTPRWRSATARPRASKTTSPSPSSTTMTTPERNSRRSMRTGMRPIPRPASSTGCSTTPGPRCTGICTIIS